MNQTRMRQGNLEGPLVIVAMNDQTLILVKKEDATDPMADAQLFELDQGPEGEFFDQIKPLAIWLKFMFGVDVVEPAIAWTEQERTLRVEAYKAAEKARAAANDN